MVGDAAFALQANAPSAPLAARFGTVILRVSKIEADAHRCHSRKFRSRLREDMSLNRAYVETTKLHDQVEDERGAGTHARGDRKKLNLALVISIEAIDRSGRKPDGQPIVDVPQLELILTQRFRARKGVDTDAIELRESRSTVWYEVADIKPSRERTFEEAKADAEKRWKDDQIGKKLAEACSWHAEEARMTARPSLPPPPACVEKRGENLKRDATVPGVDANTVARVFLTAQGKSGLGNPENSVDRIVFRVTKIDVPATPPSSELVQQVSQSIQEDLQVQYVNRLTTDLGYARQRCRAPPDHRRRKMIPWRSCRTNAHSARAMPKASPNLFGRRWLPISRHLSRRI